MQHDGTPFAAYVNEKTGTPYWVIDVDSLDFTLGRAVTLSSETDVEAAARAFLATHARVFNISPKLLGTPRITTDGDLWFISFPQRHAGLPVLGASAGLTVNHTGRIVVLGIQAFPDLEVNTTPGLSASSAVQVARTDAGRPTVEVAGEQNLVILPIERSDHYGFHLAWCFRLKDFSNEDPFSTTFLVDAHEGTVLAQQNNILHSTSPGTAFRSEASEPNVTLGAPLARPYGEPLDFSMPQHVSDASPESPSRSTSPTATGKAHHLPGRLSGVGRGQDDIGAIASIDEHHHPEISLEMRAVEPFGVERYMRLVLKHAYVVEPTQIIEAPFAVILLGRAPGPALRGPR